MRVVAEREAEEILGKEGFPIIPHGYARTFLEALRCVRRLGYPVVVKVSSQKILHKTDVGGVRVDIRNDAELKKVFAQVRRIRGCEGVLVQKFIAGHQLLVGLKCDPVFGHVVALGSGGVFTEILKDVTFRVCPIQKSDALEMIEEVKIVKVLKGARGQKKADLGKIVEFLVRLSRFPERYPFVRELDVNPLIVDGARLFVADARMVFSASGVPS